MPRKSNDSIITNRRGQLSVSIPLAELARKSGVGKTSVHRYFSDTSSVSKTIRAKIEGAMAGLRVVKPSSAAAMVIVPDLENPYFTRVARMFETTIRAHDVCPFIASSGNDTRKEREIITDAKRSGIKAWVMVAVNPASTVVHQLMTCGEPVLLVDRFVSGIQGNYDCIGTNNNVGISMIMEYLLGSGHKRIAFLGGMPGTTSAEERRSAYEECCAKHGLDVRPEWLFDGMYDVQSGIDCARELLRLDSRLQPTAVVSANDLMAIGLIGELQERGVKVPAQMSITGFDNITPSVWLKPRLSTVDQDLEVITNHGIKMLISRIRDNRERPRFVRVEPRLVQGDSITTPRSEPLVNYEGLRLSR
jgi:DNA-binding LacI/PurR family transcriptional regulator